jgi:hypothetical protein
MSTTSDETHFSHDGAYHDLPYSAPLERVSANKLSPYDAFLADPTFLTALPHDHFIATSSSCPICTEHSAHPTIQTTCKHVFHNVCLNTWLRELVHDGKEGTCPCCRNVLFRASRETESELGNWLDHQIMLDNYYASGRQRQLEAWEAVNEMMERDQRLEWAAEMQRTEATARAQAGMATLRPVATPSERMNRNAALYALLRCMERLMGEFEQDHDDANTSVFGAAHSTTSPMTNSRSDIDSAPVSHPWAPSASDTVKAHAETYPSLDRVRERAAEADREHVRRMRRDTRSNASAISSRSQMADQKRGASSRERSLRAQDIRDDITPRRGIAIANQDNPFTLENRAVERDSQASRDATSSASRANLRRRPA